MNKDPLNKDPLSRMSRRHSTFSGVEFHLIRNRVQRVRVRVRVRDKVRDRVRVRDRDRDRVKG